jgi:xanthine/CO dehydrogenase XdhC/CoxF family maturation factor
MQTPHDQENQILVLTQAIEKYLPDIKRMAGQVISPADNYLARMAKDFEMALAGAPAEELTGSFPVVLYFAADADRRGFLEAVQQAKPGLIAKAL